MMKRKFSAFLVGILAPCTVFAAGEGVPSYYQKNSANGTKYTNYVGSSGQKQVVASRVYNYQVPVQNSDYTTTMGTMTPNGIALPLVDEKRTSIYASYGRRFADFEFETGVNSILEWDDMIFNEFTAGLRHNFSLGSFDLGVFGEYTYGTMERGGLSMDYDLKPYDTSSPQYAQDGIFTISIGDQSGKTHHMKFGLSAHHMWDIGGWKLSPSIGYEIFKHNLQMSNHYYPNPGVYIPLMTTGGDYVFQDEGLQYYDVPIELANYVVENYNWTQICVSPTEIKLVDAGTSGDIYNLPSLDIGDYYHEGMGIIPWGVNYDECVIIGGDGAIVVPGTTHIYETTWSGFYIGLEVEKQMTLSDKLRFYVQFGLPKYSSQGTWPNRTDWQQNPSFLDEGSNGAYSYMAELEYNMRLSDRLQLAIKVDTNYFHVGNIGGELYIAESVIPVYDPNEDVWVLNEQPAYTEHISDSLTRATWRSFGLNIGLKFSF